MVAQYSKCIFALYVFYVVNSNGATASQQALTNEVEELLEYKLTKLLDIHVGKVSNNFQSSLCDNIRSEVRSIFEGLRNELKSDHLDGRTDSTDGLNNFQQMSKALKELYSDISRMKQNISKTLINPESMYHDDVKNFINKSPVGVSYDNQVSLSEHLYPSNLWRNSNYVPKNCKDIQSQGYNVSGVYKIQPPRTTKPIMVLCDMDTLGGGWTHVQKRYDGSQDFYLNWREYKFGFGDLEREFWLGLENIYYLTNAETNELLVQLVDRDNIKAYAHYKAFEIGPEGNGYPLKILSGFSGDAGDSFTYHLGMKFTTKDFDQDRHDGNCADICTGGWWFNACHYSNLNGKLINADLPTKHQNHGVQWRDAKMSKSQGLYSFAKSRMLVRPATQ